MDKWCPIGHIYNMRTTYIFSIYCLLTVSQLFSGCTKDSASETGILQPDTDDLDEQEENLSDEDSGDDMPIETDENHDMDAGLPESNGDQVEEMTDDDQSQNQQDDELNEQPAHIDGPGTQGVECIFNADCAIDLRCECNEQDGCTCREGERGSGLNGIDTCESGEDCHSSLCVEGPLAENGIFYCSEACTSNADCGGQLPICSDIALIGQICVRQP